MNSANYAEIPSPNTALRPRLNKRTNLKMIASAVIVVLVLLGLTYRSKAATSRTNQTIQTAELMRTLQAAQQANMYNPGSVPMHLATGQQPVSLIPGTSQFQRPITHFQRPMPVHEPASLAGGASQRLLSSAVRFPATPNYARYQQAAFPQPVTAHQFSSLIGNRQSIYPSTVKMPLAKDVARLQQELAEHLTQRSNFQGLTNRAMTQRMQPLPFINHASPYVPTNVKSQFPVSNKLMDALAKAKQTTMTANEALTRQNLATSAASSANHLITPTLK